MLPCAARPPACYPAASRSRPAAATEKERVMRPFLIGVLLTGCAALSPWTVDRAAAQARGSAEAAAARRVNPHWKAPRTAWGHPDLEGTWTTDDMRGVPMARPAQFGTRLYLTDEEFAARAKQRETAR